MFGQSLNFISDDSGTLVWWFTGLFGQVWSLTTVLGDELRNIWQQLFWL
jgi:hypothetical protein